MFREFVVNVLTDLLLVLGAVVFSMGFMIVFSYLCACAVKGRWLPWR